MENDLIKSGNQGKITTHETIDAISSLYYYYYYYLAGFSNAGSAPWFYCSYYGSTVLFSGRRRCSNPHLINVVERQLVRTLG